MVKFSIPTNSSNYSLMEYNQWMKVDLILTVEEYNTSIVG